MGKLKDNLINARPTKKMNKNKIKKDRDNKKDREMIDELESVFGEKIKYNCLNCMRNMYDKIISNNINHGYISDDELICQSKRITREG
uniref:Uncharacterized protein n=1 Tax=viral metagenome TaxID=1070528 RepID=A0A6C0H699_9ZZZZ